VLIRSWNLFHGNTVPPQRRSFLEEAVRLASADRPDVLCLQEVPAWALGRLGRWSEMEAFPALAARPILGPLPIPPELGRRLTALHSGVLRSAFSGQGNAILVSRSLRAAGHQLIVLNPRGFRAQQARWLGLDVFARLAWAKERRVCQRVRVELRDERVLVVGNLHATSYWPDQRLPDAELLRGARFASAAAGPGDVVVLAGDFNVSPGRSRTLADLVGAEWGFSTPGPRIDHVLVRGAETNALRVWPDERRRLGDALLSDHAPVELDVS
jgi:endonuclease/exonuclease/phosphatase family metal-dependent hydrolase